MFVSIGIQETSLLLSFFCFQEVNYSTQLDYYYLSFKYVLQYMGSCEYFIGEYHLDTL